MPLPQPAPMEGHGAYNRNSAVQAAGIAQALEWLRLAAREAALPEAARPVIVADYGCAQGHNSLRPMRVAIEALRPRIGGARPVSVFHTDLPGNDWPALFQTLATDPDSYLAGQEAVFPAAIGRSFLLRLLPPASVSLGWSSWALHWLGASPMPIPDHLHVACSRDTAVRAAYAAEADADWRGFLAARAAELLPGGQLVLLFRAAEDRQEDSYLGVFEAAWQAVCELERAGGITAAERARMVVPTYGRTRAELLAPFVAGMFHGLRLDGLDIIRGDDPIWRETGQGADASAYGARWAAFFRAAAFPSLAAALDSGDERRRADFMDAAEAEMRRRLAADLRPRPMPLACIRLSRQA